MDLNLSPGTHLQFCNLPKGSLESVSEIDFPRIRVRLGIDHALHIMQEKYCTFSTSVVGKKCYK